MSQKKIAFHKKVFYFLTGQLTRKKLELKLKRVEERFTRLEERLTETTAYLKRFEQEHYEHVARFTATAAYYERRIDALVNSYSKKLAHEGTDG